MREFLFGIAEITLGMSLLILLMLILLKLIGGKFTAKCRYILWTLVMIRLAVPFSFGILPALIEVPVESEPEPVQIQIPVVSYTPIPQEPVTIPQQEQLQMPSPPAETPMFTEPEPEPLTREEISSYIPHLYLTGAAVFLLWNLLSYGIYTGRIVRSSKPADPEALRVYETVCRKKEVHRPPILLMSPGLSSPAAFGLIRRRIVLPDIGLSENGLAGTLSHEVTHCKRGDLWIKAVCLLARSFHWFNPFVHLAAFRCEMEMELSCDESVLTGCSEETRAAYGEVMLDIIRRCRRNRGSLTTHFNPKKNAVKARFTNILYGSGKRKGLWLIAVCLVLCLVAGAIVACRTDVPEDEPEPELTETPDELLPEVSESGEYPSMEAYVNEHMAQKKTISYYSVSRHNASPDSGSEAWTATANVTDTNLTVFEKKGEVAGLSEQGVLECWEYRYLLKLDVPADDVMTVDGDFDGWFDMDGQHTVVALRHPDGTYTVLMDNITGDGIDFTGYRDTYEEAIYDWYVTESGLDLPLYVEDWSEQITSPTGEYLGNHPVHRFDGDGWGIYIPVSAWYRSPDAMENQWIWCSSYLTGSMLTVDVFSHTLEDEYVTAELQGYAPTDRTNRIWELQADDIHSYYYYYENPDGGFWRVTIGWTEEAITDYPAIAIEPQVLKRMAESFVVIETGDVAENTYTEISVIEKVPEAAEPEPAVQPEPEAEDSTGLVTEEFDLLTREEWITYSLNTDFGFREPVDVSALTDAELEVYMTDAYSCAKDIYTIYEVNSDTMYGGRYWSTTMPNVIIDNSYYSKMYNPVFRTMADWEGYMRGILSDELVERLVETDIFIDYEGELWGLMGARGTDFSRKTISYSVTSRSDSEIIYTAEVEFRMELGSEEPDNIEYYNFTYSLTENGWRWTDFYLYQ